MVKHQSELDQPTLMKHHNNMNMNLDSQLQPSFVKSKSTDAQKAVDPNSLPVMNSRRLEKFSAKYTADTGDTVEQRCFFLFAGSDLN